MLTLYLWFRYIHKRNISIQESLQFSDCRICSVVENVNISPGEGFSQPTMQTQRISRCYLHNYHSYSVVLNQPCVFITFGCCSGTCCLENLANCTISGMISFLSQLLVQFTSVQATAYRMVLSLDYMKKLISLYHYIIRKIQCRICHLISHLITSI